MFICNCGLKYKTKSKQIKCKESKKHKKILKNILTIHFT